MNNNTHLCNTAWGEKFLARVTQCTCFCFSRNGYLILKGRKNSFCKTISKTVTEIFLGALARSGNRRVKRPFHRERKKIVISTTNVIKEIKQTKT